MLVCPTAGGAYYAVPNCQCRADPRARAGPPLAPGAARPVTGGSLGHPAFRPLPVATVRHRPRASALSGSSMPVHRLLRSLASVLGPGPQAGATPRHLGARRWRPNVDRASGLSATAGSLSLPPRQRPKDRARPPRPQCRRRARLGGPKAATGTCVAT